MDIGNCRYVWKLMRVKKKTWEDDGDISASGPDEGLLEEVTVNRTLDSELLQSGTAKIVGKAPEGYVRVILELISESERRRIEVATLLCSTPETEKSSIKHVAHCTLYSVLLPAKWIELPHGWFFPGGGNLVGAALDLLGQYIDAPIEYTAPTSVASKAIHAEDGETVLSMVQLMLKTAGYHLDIDGHGRVRAIKDGKGKVDVMDRQYTDEITGTLTDKLDLFNVYNVVNATDGHGNWEQAINARADSETSTVSTGFKKMTHTSVTLEENQTLLDAAYSFLDEQSRKYNEVTYTRTHDELRPGDERKIHRPDFAVEGRFEIATQQINSTNGPLMTETVRRVVDTFKR